MYVYTLCMYIHYIVYICIDIIIDSECERGERIYQVVRRTRKRATIPVSGVGRKEGNVFRGRRSQADTIINRICRLALSS